MAENRGYTGLSAEHISTQLDTYEAARSGFFNFIIDEAAAAKIGNQDADNNLAKASFSGDEMTEGDYYTPQQFQEAIKLNVVKCDVPHFSVEVLRYRRGNDEVKFAGVPTFNEGSLVIDDVVGLDTKGILMAWQAKTYDVRTRKGGRMADYKYNCTLIEYTQDFKEVRRWKLYGCFPSAVSEDGFDRESDGRRQISATIEYDRAEMLEPNRI